MSFFVLDFNGNVDQSRLSEQFRVHKVLWSRKLSQSKGHRPTQAMLAGCVAEGCQHVCRDPPPKSESSARRAVQCGSVRGTSAFPGSKSSVLRFRGAGSLTHVSTWTWRTSLRTWIARLDFGLYFPAQEVSGASEGSAESQKWKRLPLPPVRRPVTPACWAWPGDRRVLRAFFFLVPCLGKANIWNWLPNLKWTAPWQFVSKNPVYGISKWKHANIYFFACKSKWVCIRFESHKLHRIETKACQWVLIKTRMNLFHSAQ